MREEYYNDLREQLEVSFKISEKLGRPKTLRLFPDYEKYRPELYYKKVRKMMNYINQGLSKEDIIREMKLDQS